MQCSYLVGWFLKPHAADLSRDPHTSEGKPLFYQASVPQSLSFASRPEGCTEGALWFEDHCSPFLPVTQHTPFYHLPFSLTQKGGVGRRVVDHQVAILIFLKKMIKIICCQLHSHILWSLIGGPLRNYVSQVFNPQVTKMNIHLYNLYYFLYL